MNPYEQKQADKKARLERAAQRRRDESHGALDRAHNLVKDIPMGQPILVGHHSEKRHRRTLAKHDRAMRRGIELEQEARELAHRADAVGTGGISSDDPDAVPKLTTKVVELEQRQQAMRAQNAYYRKHKTMKGCPGVSEAAAAALDADIPTRYTWERKGPFPPYQLSNLSARIRQAKARVLQVERDRQIEVKPKVIGSATIICEDDRVQVRFVQRISRERYKSMRRYGFVWSPSRTAYVRKINHAALAAAVELAERFLREDHDGPTPQQS